ncbi:hypothetical protein PQO01_15645 [Lentisphaera marina]|uniref:WD40 domain-containing protein n=1 Tax=Lentisphaera marina TaxID=1111041 RepID=UPI002365F634|nr:c-type cytochrome domain-containing protein [Lentisphaera marina]MDD7986383.1 hypothetical protein [Lentisphaera marina]
MYANFFSSLLTILFISSLNAQKITYDEHIRQIFKADCSECHNSNKAKGGLDLSSYLQTMAGSSAGEVVSAGDPENSVLFECITTDDSDIRMPPKGARMNKNDIEMIKNWILAGALENRHSKKKLFVKNDAFKATETKKGEVILPDHLSLLSWQEYSYPGPAKTMALSPFSPLVAFGLYKQVALYNSQTQNLLGYLDFPEGSINGLSFSSNGQYIIAVGGHIGNEGFCVIWDIKSGRRIFSLKHESMDIHVAHVSPDMKLLAIGSNDKKIKVYSLENKELLLEEKAHSEWVSALRFSPDGKYIVSGDRNGQLIIWDAKELSKLHTLYKHKGRISALAWRPDSKVFASASDDASIMFFDPLKASNLKTLKIHKGAVNSLSYNEKGQLCSTGNDHQIRVYDSAYKQVAHLDCNKRAPLLNAVYVNDKIIASNYAGRMVIKEKANKEAAFLTLFPKNLLQLNKSQTINLEKERLNKKRHLEMFKEFEFKEKIQSLKLEQLYLLDEIKSALDDKTDLIALNQLYTKNSEYFHLAYELKLLTKKSQESQLNLLKQMNKMPQQITSADQ